MMNLAAGDLTILHLADESRNVVAHQIEFVNVSPFGWMDRDFGGRQRKDQPSAADIDIRQFEDVASKRSIGFGILAVNDRVRPDTHV